MSTNTSFGVTASGLIHLLSTTIDQLNAIGYFNGPQTVFIQRFAFKCDDALMAAASFGEIAGSSHTRESDTIIAYFKKVPVVKTSITGIKTESDAAIATIATNNHKIEVILCDEIINTDNGSTPDDVHMADSGTKIESVSESDQNGNASAFQHTEQTTECLSSDIVHVDVVSAFRDGTEKLSKREIVFDQDFELPSLTVKDNEVVKETHGKGATSASVENASTSEGEVVHATVTVVVEEAVDEFVEHTAADVCPYVILESKCESISIESIMKNETEASRDTASVVGETSSTAIESDTESKEFDYGLEKKSEVSTFAEVVINLPPTSHSSAAASLTHTEAEGLSRLETASVGSGSATETCSAFPHEEYKKSGVKPKVHLPSVSSATFLATKGTEQTKVAPVVTATKSSAVDFVESKVPACGINGDKSHRRAAIVVQMKHVGFNHGKKNIKFETRIWDDSTKKATFSTTFHHPGATLMAMHYQSGSPHQDGVLPFLEVQKGDYFELIEQRSLNLYLVRQKQGKRLEGLVKIARNDMTKKQADSCGCLQAVANAASTKPSGPESLKSPSSSVSLEEKIRMLVKSMPSTPKISPQSSPKTSPKLSPKSPVKKISPKRSSLSKPGDRPEYQRSKAIARPPPPPCDPNAPHMQALSAWKDYTHEPYSDERPQRHRFVDIWTPDATGGMRLPAMVL